MSTCRSCGAVIEWVKTTKDKWMPIDADTVNPAEMEPNDILVSEEGDCCKASNVDSSYDTTWHISHFATCPKADEHRKGKP